MILILQQVPVEGQEMMQLHGSKVDGAGNVEIEDGKEATKSDPSDKTFV